MFLLNLQRKTILKGAKEEYRKKKAKEYVRRCVNTTSARTYSCLKNSSNGKKNANKLNNTYLRTPESTPSPSENDEKQQKISPSSMKCCIQQ